MPRIDQVKIYIETSLAGPCVKDGWYAAVVECQTSKGTRTAELTGMEENTTYYRSVLLAAVSAIQRLKYPCSIKIYTQCSYVKNMYERGIAEKWKKDGWKKADGKEVENKDLWQRLLGEAGRMGGIGKIEFRFSKHNDYRDLMRDLIAGKKEEDAGRQAKNGGKP